MFAANWRAIDAEGEVLDVLVQSKRDKHATLKLMRKLLKKYGFIPDRTIADDLRSYGAAAHDLGNRETSTGTGGRDCEPGSINCSKYIIEGRSLTLLARRSANAIVVATSTRIKFCSRRLDRRARRPQ
jgi:transposase-like protein